ncbi:LacI family transcriptional regulator [Tessaracoccus sp. OS52]|uniref:LacI family DNA-binding transcriptional regulator n=1 Tax=Tessaracoccus sp. OS52 TaxID=2886691 RepID=UPI001D10FE79|nr:LacI family DNA-binding transcriptional regulator [Tessaracoccus sp. OS52]MCC2594057.1 LacI family transcriptional regulator [Tessaracoccus sp. OS52]
MIRSKAPTLEMVAAHAGVSRATVSRVVNGTPTVDPKVAEVVRRSVEALKYVPNRAARSLASQRTLSIALVVPESTARFFADPFFGALVQGAALELAPSDYTLNMIIESEDQVAKTMRYLLGGNVDGALVVSHQTGDHSWASIAESLPVVFGGRPMKEPDGDSYYVDVDNVAGARSAVGHLLARGRRRIATITGPPGMPGGLDRIRGWRAELEAAGLEPGPLEEGAFTAESGRAATRRLVERGEPFDAVFIASDEMAVASYGVLREAGLRIPEDVAVVGYDDATFSASAVPPLTTVRQPTLEMGATMARVLVDLIEGRPAERVTILQTELVVREST